MGIVCISNVTEWRWCNVAKKNSTESVNLYGGVFRCRGSTFSQDVISSTHSFRSVASFCQIKAAHTSLNRRERERERERESGVDFPVCGVPLVKLMSKVLTLYMKSLIK